MNRGAILNQFIFYNMPRFRSAFLLNLNRNNVQNTMKRLLAHGIEEICLRNRCQLSISPLAWLEHSKSTSAADFLQCFCMRSLAQLSVNA